jgi:hypothetical protein
MNQFGDRSVSERWLSDMRTSIFLSVRAEHGEASENDSMLLNRHGSQAPSSSSTDQAQSTFKTLDQDPLRSKTSEVLWASEPTVTIQIINVLWAP